MISLPKVTIIALAILAVYTILTPAKADSIEGLERHKVVFNQKLDCYPTNMVPHVLLEKYNETPMMMGYWGTEQDKLGITTVYLNAETLSYTVTLTNEKATCIISSGKLLTPPK